MAQEPLGLDEVALRPGTHLAAAAATNRRYLLALEPDTMLYAWRRNARRDTRRARPMRGWESPGAELRGHFLGHYLSAAAFAHATAPDATYTVAT